MHNDSISMSLRTEIMFFSAELIDVSLYTVQ